MAIVTLRLNQEEEKILRLLVKHLEQDKSKILKEAMWDKFEELRDRELIEGYEKKSRAGKIKFASADGLIDLMEEPKPVYKARTRKPAQRSKRRAA
jgi:predicted DNA-binding protein